MKCLHAYDIFLHLKPAVYVLYIQGWVEKSVVCLCEDPVQGTPVQVSWTRICSDSNLIHSEFELKHTCLCGSIVSKAGLSQPRWSWLPDPIRLIPATNRTLQLLMLTLKGV